MYILKVLMSMNASIVYVLVAISFSSKIKFSTKKKLIAFNYLLIAINCFLLILYIILYSQLP